MYSITMITLSLWVLCLWDVQYHHDHTIIVSLVFMRCTVSPWSHYHCESRVYEMYSITMITLSLWVSCLWDVQYHHDHTIIVSLVFMRWYVSCIAAESLWVLCLWDVQYYHDHTIIVSLVFMRWYVSCIAAESLWVLCLWDVQYHHDHTIIVSLVFMRCTVSPWSHYHCESRVYEMYSITMITLSLWVSCLWDDYVSCIAAES